MRTNRFRHLLDYASLDGRKDFAGVHVFTSHRRQRYYAPGLGRLHLILHLHRLHHHKSLAGGHHFALRDQYADDFSRHGGDDVLAAFGLTMVSLPAPAARVQNFNVKASAADRDLGSRDSRFVTALAHKYRIHARLNLSNIGSLLFFRLNVEAAGFTVLSPVQADFASVEQDQRYRNNCSLPSERQLEAAGLDGESCFRD